MKHVPPSYRALGLMLRVLLAVILVSSPVLAGNPPGLPARPQIVPLVGSGSSGNPDGSVAINGGGTQASHGQIQYTAAIHQFFAYDGSEQFRVGLQPGAAEFWQAMGGLAGDGGTLLATNGTFSGNISGNFAALNAGGFNFGNGSGQILSLPDPGGPVGAYFTLLPANAAGFAGATAAVESSGDLALVALGGAGRLTNCVPNGALPCGNNRATGSIDLQYSRGNVAQVAGGTASATIGGASNSIGSLATYGFIGGGFSLAVTGPYSQMVGQNGTDQGRYAYMGLSAGYFSSPGDAQIGQSVLRAAGASASTVLTPTANNGALSSTNCFNLVQGQTIAFRVTISGNDKTTPASYSAYYNNVVVHRDTTNAMQFSAGTPVTLGPATPTIAFSTNTSTACLVTSITPPSADIWHYTERLDSTEAE